MKLRSLARVALSSLGALALTAALVLLSPLVDLLPVDLLAAGQGNGPHFYKVVASEPDNALAFWLLCVGLALVAIGLLGPRAK